MTQDNKKLNPKEEKVVERRRNQKRKPWKTK